MSETTRRNIAGHSPYESKVGFSRVVVVGDRALCAGTVAIDESGLSVAPGDAGAQARYIFEMLLGKLGQAGFGPESVVRTRTFITDGDDEDAVAAAHAEALPGVMPAATMVVIAGLVRPELRVEIEVEAQKG
ncbi:MAG: Rid family hydrolase [Planctomycetota bacterium]